MSLNYRQRKALARLRGDMSLERAPMPPIYTYPSVRMLGRAIYMAGVPLAVLIITIWVCML